MPRPERLRRQMRHHHQAQRHREHARRYTYGGNRSGIVPRVVLTIRPGCARQPAYDEVEEGERADDEGDNRRAGHGRLERRSGVRGVVWRDLEYGGEDDPADEPGEGADEEGEGEPSGRDDEEHLQDASRPRAQRAGTALSRGLGRALSRSRGGVGAGAGFDVRSRFQDPKRHIAVSLRVFVVVRVSFVRKRLVTTRYPDWKPRSGGFRGMEDIGL